MTALPLCDKICTNAALQRAGVLNVPGNSQRFLHTEGYKVNKKTKIGIIGAGHVGSHVAASLMTQGLCDELVLLDTDTKKARGHAQDLADSAPHLPRPAAVRAGDYGDLADADLVVLSVCGTYFEEDRLRELDATAALAAQIAPQLTASGFAGIVLSISNPCDVIAQYFAQLTGLNVVGTGTSLDSGRLRRRLAALLGVSAADVCAYELGEHGDSQIAALHAAAVGGLPLAEWVRRYAPQLAAPQAFERAFRETVTAGWDIVQGKGCTEFGIGAACARLAGAILHDEKAVLACSAMLRGEYGQTGVYAGVPCVVGAGGAERVVELPLTAQEQAGFARSCEVVRAHVQKLTGRQG